jgi:hypothetical protein
MSRIARLTLTLFWLAPLVAHPGEATTIRWAELTANAGGGKGFVQISAGDILAARTHGRSNETYVVCSRSEDGGRTWRDLSTIVRVPGAQDLGDGHLVQIKSGEVLYSFRQNSARVATNGMQTYSIRIAASRDGGRSWQPHSVVAESEAHPVSTCGLWSSFLLARRDGTLLCFYDDEATPDREGFHRHQWLMAKTWHPGHQAWERPVAVSRAEGRLLSRDGMASVLELKSGRLLAALESAQTDKPHANLIRFVTSDDGGATWSWQANARGVLFEPADRRHMAVAPWLAQGPDDTLVCVFATDEDRTEPDQPGTPPARFHMDIKCVLSRDGGRTWTRQAQPVFTTSHRCYAPGVAVLQDGSLLVTCADFATRRFPAFRGDLTHDATSSTGR